MQYTKFGQTKIKVSRMGLGTNRFSPEDLVDNVGISRAAAIARAALEGGVNYIDCAYTYSKGKAELIMREALNGWKEPVHFAIKAALNTDRTSDAVLRRIESSLKSLNIDKATFFLAWTITSYEEYQQTMKKNGYYAGACKAKERGLIDHICFATHCRPEETVKIIQEGMFEGVTINYSVLNSNLNLPVLEAAQNAGMGVVTMSSLATGVIPKNPDFFDFIRLENDKSVGQAALRFAASQKAITTTLCGVSSVAQLKDNIKALEQDTEQENRYYVVEKRFEAKKGYCDGCGECSGLCEAKIDLKTYMQSYNARYFGKGIASSYARTDPELIEDIEIFKKLKQDYSIMPQTIQNPCTNCGKCVNVCPKEIEIKGAIADIYKRAEKRSFSKEAWKKRLSILLNQKYKKVGFYPAGGYTGYVLNYFREFYGEIPFEMAMFDSNRAMWGKECLGNEIMPPCEIEKEKPDCILITNYIYSDEIYKDLKKYMELGIEIVPLHEPEDVPWVF